VVITVEGNRCSCIETAHGGVNWLDSPGSSARSISALASDGVDLRHTRLQAELGGEQQAGLCRTHRLGGIFKAG